MTRHRARWSRGEACDANEKGRSNLRREVCERVAPAPGAEARRARLCLRAPYRYIE